MDIDLKHHTIEANGISMHVVEAGEGPAVLLCHGFPESWYSWRAQIKALAMAGYRAIAPDMRGYGGTSKPRALDAYTILHLVGDMVGLLKALSLSTAAIVGHDWGAPVAWHCALLRPDLFKAVVGLSVPFYPHGRRQPSQGWPETAERIFYQTYFQEPGVAEAEFERNTGDTLRKMTLLWSSEGADHSAEKLTMVARGGGWLSSQDDPGLLPGWLTEDDLAFYAAEFQRSGFRGPLNWYRNIDRNWQLMAPWAGKTVDVPSLYMVGERDLLLTFPGMDRLLPNLARFVALVEPPVILPACGHWIQRERAQDVNRSLRAFLKTHYG